MTTTGTRRTEERLETGIWKVSAISLKVIHEENNTERKMTMYGKNT